MERVQNLIEGFETPYGLELLATVHWVATQEGAATEDEAIKLVQAWNPRKKKIMQPPHLRIAWRRLHQQGWIT